MHRDVLTFQKGKGSKVTKWGSSAPQEMWLQDMKSLGSWEGTTELVFAHILPEQLFLTMAAIRWALTVQRPTINDIKPRNFL